MNTRLNPWGLMLVLGLLAPATVQAQYSGKYSKKFHGDLHELSQHLIIVSSLTMYLASRALAKKKGRAKTVKYLTTYLKTSSMAVIELRQALTALRQAFLEASSKKVKTKLYKGRRATRKDVKLMVNKYVAGVDNFYSLSSNMVQRFTTATENKEISTLIVHYRNQIRGIANSY